MADLPIVAAGREIPDGLDRIRRYCGLAWSRGAPETWAWRYYDLVPSDDDDVVAPVDVVCAAALHPGLSRADLTFFWERVADLSAWLAELPSELRLWQVTDGDVKKVASLPERFPDVSLSLLSKVLHRKRPHLIPLLDRHVIDWYRPVTGKRAMAEAWAPLIEAMRAEESDDERRLVLARALSPIEQELWQDFDTFERPRFSWLRATDIAIWMGSR